MYLCTIKRQLQCSSHSLLLKSKWIIVICWLHIQTSIEAVSTEMYRWTNDWSIDWLTFKISWIKWLTNVLNWTKKKKMQIKCLIVLWKAVTNEMHYRWTTYYLQCKGYFVTLYLHNWQKFAQIKVHISDYLLLCDWVLKIHHLFVKIVPKR